MKLFTGIVTIALLFTFMEVTDAAMSGTLFYKGKWEDVKFGCHQGYCWSYCGSSWVSFFSCPWISK